MSLRIQKVTAINDIEAQKMFEWEIDPENKFYATPCKGPDEPPRFQTWQELQTHVNKSNAHRFTIYEDKEFVGEFNFVFGSNVLIKKEPHTAWIGIGIGDAHQRGKGIGTLAMQTIEHEVKALNGTRIELGVLSFNAPAIKFYEKLGYRRFSEIPEFTWWNGQWWSDLRYEKFL